MDEDVGQAGGGGSCDGQEPSAGAQRRDQVLSRSAFPPYLSEFSVII